VEVVAVELAHLVLVAHRDQQDPRVTQVLLALPDLRAMLGNADLQDRKDLGVFRVLLDPLVAELEEPLFLAPKDLGVLLVLLDLRGNKESRVLPDLRAITDFLAQPEQTVNLDLRVRMARPVLPGPLDLRALPDQLAPQANVVLPDRMQSLLSSISTSPRLRRLRLMVRRQMSKTHSDRRTRLRMVPGTTRQ
jgi:hypothetical protein